MDPEIRKKILDIVHLRPRAIAEVAYEINKNWRTADRYVNQLASEDLIKVWVFRKGSRGSLKIAYWPSSLEQGPSGVKNFLLQRILNGVKKEDFSPLDIIQNVSKDKRKIIYLTEQEYETEENLNHYLKRIENAENNILFFSGNLSFLNLANRYNEFLNTLDNVLEKGVSLFILTRVDNTNLNYIEDILQLNNKNHRGRIEIRYSHQPLRCTVIDRNEAAFKENFRDYSLNKNMIIGTNLYFIYDLDWVNWIADIFWHIWRSSINAEKRLEVLKEIKIR